MTRSLFVLAGVDGLNGSGIYMLSCLTLKHKLVVHWRVASCHKKYTKAAPLHTHADLLILENLTCYDLRLACNVETDSLLSQ
jgi:hypothetical protein